MLLVLAILNDSAPMAEQTVLDDTLLDLSGILTIKKEMSSFMKEVEMKLSILYFDV